MIIISEKEFVEKLKEKLLTFNIITEINSVTGPGRSGAITSSYASYLLEIPFIPYGENISEKLKPILIIDTARKSGRTLRKAQKKYGNDCIITYLYDEPPRVRFWYEFIKV